MIDTWLEKVKGFLEKLNMLDVPHLVSRLWNTDETDFCTSMTLYHVLDVHETSGGSRNKQLSKPF